MFDNPKLREIASIVADSIATVLNVDVVILDDKKNKVAGTVSTERTYYVSNVYEHIKKTMKSVIIQNPGENLLCEGCKYYGNCSELIEIDSPIIVNGEVTGIFSITTYDPRTRELLLEKLDSYSAFITQMCNLLAFYAEDDAVKRELNNIALEIQAIIDGMDDGILVLDNNQRIKYFNVKIPKLLGDSKEHILGSEIHNWIPDYPLITGSESGHVEMDIVKGDKTHIKAYVYINFLPDSASGDGATIVTITGTKKLNIFVAEALGYNHEYVSFDQIVGCSSQIKGVVATAKQIANSNSNILITGESGTGKEIFARAIHNESYRKGKPFIAINCGAIPDTLLESELFGYESGAFTGANKMGKPGKFELANGGTIFLDEIAELPLHLQVKILRVIQERTVQRVGGIKEVPLDIRIISATNKDLFRMAQTNNFRADLFYRLNVISLNIPPLRNRGNDISILVDFFLKKHSRLLGKKIKKAGNGVMNILYQYRWPGNIRELENVIEHGLNMEKSEILTVDSLPEYLRDGDISKSNGDVPMKVLVENYERKILQERLNKFGSSTEGKNAAAQSLGIGIATLYRKLKDYKLN